MLVRIELWARYVLIRPANLDAKSKVAGFLSETQSTGGLSLGGGQRLALLAAPLWKL